MSKKLPSPCVDVCKYKRKNHCIACSMTKAQKKQFKALKRAGDRAAFVDMLIEQQHEMGKFGAWPKLYAKKCAKKGVPLPELLRGEAARQG